MNAHLSLVLVGVFTSLVGVYYYFRVIIAMFFREPSGGHLSLSFSLRVFLSILAAASLLLGLDPALALLF